MKKIKAKVNTRLLTKADRLFTGTVEGRAIELPQNARRSGATKVQITNEDGYTPSEQLSPDPSRAVAESSHQS
jgi:hypothetical protein